MKKVFSSNFEFYLLILFPHSLFNFFLKCWSLNNPKYIVEYYFKLSTFEYWHVKLFEGRTPSRRRGNNIQNPFKEEGKQYTEPLQGGGETIYDWSHKKKQNNVTLSVYIRYIGRLSGKSTKTGSIYLRGWIQEI